MISVGGFGYDLWMVGQIVLAIFLYKKYKKQLANVSSLNTLILSPIAPVISLFLFAITRAKSLDYYKGLVYILPLGFVVLTMKQMGPLIIIFSIVITAIGYTSYEFFALEAENNIWISIVKSLRPIIFSLIIGYICKGMSNPISFIISCNIFADYIVSRFTKTNKNKYSIEGNDSENGSLYNLAAGFMEAALIGPPSDLVGRNKAVVDGLADCLCIINLLVNGSQRGTATVVVTNLSSAVIFFSILAIVYFYGGLQYIKEEDKVWPAIKKFDIPKITKLQLLLVTIALVCSYTLSSTSILEASMLIGKLSLVTCLCMFVRIKTVTSVFFTANMLF